MVSMVETVKCVTMLYFMKVELLQRYGDLAVFKMAAVRHLGFLVCVCLNHPQIVFGGFNLCQIWFESMQYFP